MAITSVGATSTYLCSGVIINQSWVLTVAQCINGYFSNNMKKEIIEFFWSFRSLSISVMAGSTMLYTDDTNKVTVSSINYIVHENYSTTFFQNDIGVIQLSSELPLNCKSIPSNHTKIKFYSWSPHSANCFISGTFGGRYSWYSQWLGQNVRYFWRK